MKSKQRVRKEQKELLQRVHECAEGAKKDEHIQQILNDISEGECRATKAELIDCCRYLQVLCDKWNALHQKRMFEVQGVILNHLKEMHP